jgi:glycine/D-amino acid oxidase-like deaminating enzyme
MESLWVAKSNMPSFEKLYGDNQTDVLIIGGGIAGILTAYHLQQKGIKYILVEKDKICGETTENTTAKITIQHGLIYDKIIKNYGVEGAQKYLKANSLALKRYNEICKNIDCDYEIKDNYVYSINHLNKLENEIKALEKIGCDAKLCSSISLPLTTVGAVKVPNQAQFNPLKFISSIAKSLNIYEHTFIREIVNDTAFFENGKIKAKSIVVTTHFPFINKHGLYPLKLYQHRSYVIALSNAQKIDAMYVDESKSGLSFRQSNDLLLLGGGGHRTGEKGGCWSEIRKFANENYPNSKEKYHWAAQDCISLDSIPYIGKYSKSTPNLYVITGFNKWGMTSSMVGATIISDMIAEKENDYADIFSPSRSMIKPQLFVNGFVATKSLLTFSNKRCPHLNCALKWNSPEHSWDCPCHGSRFSTDGKVLNNPANGNINNI